MSTKDANDGSAGSKIKLTREIGSLSDLRALVAEAGRYGMADDTVIHGKTKFSWNPAGPVIREITIEGTSTLEL